VGFGTCPVILIPSPRWTKFGILRVEVGVRELGSRHWRAVGRIERKRWRPTKSTAYEREARKHVGPDKCTQGGHKRSLVVPHHHSRAAITERVDKRDLVTHHVECKKRLGIRVPRIIPAGCAAKATAVRSDRIIARSG